MRSVEKVHNKIDGILKGKIEIECDYKTQYLEEYSNNPYIEALPQIFSDEEIIDMFTMYPSISEDEKNAPLNVRYHYIKRLKSFVQPLDIHFRVERKLSSLIRRGYIARNPVSIENKKRLNYIHSIRNEIQSNDDDKIFEFNRQLRSTAEGFSITGISGMGKSVCIERLLMMYPQVIVHKEYNNEPFTTTQLVWLKVDTPYDGSIKTMCKLFFKAIDDILGTSYTQRFGTNRNSAATMMIHMMYLSSLYGIGVIVIDEIQHLTKSKNNPEQVLNFLVTLINTIGVPVIMIGTPSADDLFMRNFRQARRAGSVGSIQWDRMKNDEMWKFFVETMWEYQWIENSTPISEKLINALYDHSQGIVGLAVIIFMLSQEYALESDSKGITEKIFSDVSRNELRFVQEMIKALKTNNIQKIVKYDDIANNISELINERKPNLSVSLSSSVLGHNEKRHSYPKSTDELTNLVSEFVEFGLVNNKSKTELEKIIRSSLKAGYSMTDKTKLKKYVLKQLISLEKDDDSSLTKMTPSISTKDLRKLVNEAKKKKISCYELLNEKGVIKNPMCEFY